MSEVVKQLKAELELWTKLINELLAELKDRGRSKNPFKKLKMVRLRYDIMDALRFRQSYIIVLRDLE